MAKLLSRRKINISKVLIINNIDEKLQYFKVFGLQNSVQRMANFCYLSFDPLY
jgi:hypothetical protein